MEILEFNEEIEIACELFGLSKNELNKAKYDFNQVKESNKKIKKKSLESFILDYNNRIKKGENINIFAFTQEMLNLDSIKEGVSFNKNAKERKKAAFLSKSIAAFELTNHFPVLQISKIKDDFTWITYSSIIKLLFTYRFIEVFIDFLNYLDLEDYDHTDRDRNKASSLSTKFQNHINKKKDIISNNLTNYLSTELKKHDTLNKNRLKEPLYIASKIRNSFIHGSLAANSVNNRPFELFTISTLLSNHILTESQYFFENFIIKERWNNKL